jgi:hypothetical protein
MSAEQDLLNIIFDPEPAYPWEPFSPEAETRLDALMAEFDGDDVDAAIAAGWSAFSQQLDAQWASASPATSGVMATLTAQFQNRMPANLLQIIAAKAQGLVQEGRPMVDQLVACVNEVLPTWDATDLGVLARPMAYSLRDGRGEIVDLNLRALPEKDWESLSPVEQARLSLVVASVALQTAKED